MEPTRTPRTLRTLSLLGLAALCIWTAMPTASASPLVYSQSWTGPQGEAEACYYVDVPHSADPQVACIANGPGVPRLPVYSREEATHDGSPATCYYVGAQQVVCILW
jgi:hypothetical protein